MTTESQKQISAFVSESTKEQLERYAEAHGVKKAHVVETALLHHLEALRQIPADLIIPPTIAVGRAGAEQLLERLEKPRRPNKSMRELFKK